jgi:hypothetical protein
MERKLGRIFVLTEIAAAVMVVACGGADNSSGTQTATDASTDRRASILAATTTPETDFQTRCTAAGVVRCIGFDATGDFNIGSGGAAGAYGQNFGILAPWGTSDYTRATRDTGTAASGSSLKFTIPGNSSADSSGSFFANFSSDLQTQFGENSEFYVQWRQRFSPEFIGTKFAGGGGWKQVILGTGDSPGGPFQTSCSPLELVTQNTYSRGFAQMYNSCSGSASHGPYDAFEEAFPPYDFKLQNARPSPYCLYSSYSSSNSNCFRYFANEWMTFQVHVKTGPRVGDEFVNSQVQLWIAREGQPAELVMNWGPYNLTAGPAGENQRFGKIWLLPYNTGKDPSVTYPTSYTWYDELIISRNRIADPK